MCSGKPPKGRTWVGLSYRKQEADIGVTLVELRCLGNAEGCIYCLVCSEHCELEGSRKK